MKKPSSWQIGVAAEAIATAQFARCGYDVSVQYGADQPEYDLIVAKNETIAKVSVKGSQDGSWGLTQSFLANADYHGAIDKWLGKHGAKTLFCFVQFKDVDFAAIPRLYLARPIEIAQRLKETAIGRGDTILYEHHVWTSRAKGAGTEERLPVAWGFTAERLESMLSGS
jgi:Holliday junction resolvase-like predicted endonuclease